VAFLRFAGTSRHDHSGFEVGLFQIAYVIKESPATSQADEQAIRQQLDWFSKHLPTPARFNRSRSKGYYRRKSKGIAWFKDTASECLTRMHILKQIAKEHGYLVNVITEYRIGYIVYEDDFQVVAEPFSDTRTS
jgi:hypothetical protein